MVERDIAGFRFFVDPTKGDEILFQEDEFSDQLDGGSVDISLIMDHIAQRSERRLPLSLVWHLTRRCNFKCPFCYIRDNGKSAELQVSNATELARTLVREGLLRATLSGGECLLYEGFTDVYRLLKESGVLVTIYTNGSLIDDSILELFKALPPFSVELTLYSADYSSAPYRSILALKQLGISVIAKFTIAQSNQELLRPVEKWCEGHNIPFRFDPNLFNGSNGVDAVSQMIDEEALASLDAERYGDAAISEEKCVPRKCIQCDAASRSIFISPEGCLSLCCDLDESWDMKKDGFATAYSKLINYIETNKSRYLTHCEGCHAHFFCSMCIAHAIRTDEGYEVPDDYCESVERRFASYKRIVEMDRDAI